MEDDKTLVKIVNGQFYDINDDLILTEKNDVISVAEITNHYKKMRKLMELREVLETFLSEVADLLDNNAEVEIDVDDLVKVKDYSISAAFDPFPKKLDLGKKIEVKSNGYVFFELLKKPIKT